MSIEKLKMKLVKIQEEKRETLKYLSALSLKEALLESEILEALDSEMNLPDADRMKLDIGTQRVYTYEGKTDAVLDVVYKSMPLISDFEKLRKYIVKYNKVELLQARLHLNNSISYLEDKSKVPGLTVQVYRDLKLK